MIADSGQSGTYWLQGALDNLTEKSAAWVTRTGFLAPARAGLGARALFGDQELTPVKGQLVFLLPQAEVEYMTVGPGDIYMFPRHDGVLLGGTHDRGVWDTSVDPAVTERILRESAALLGSMRAGV